MKRIACISVLAALALPAMSPGATRTVGVEDDFFSSSSLRVSKGTTVKWVWRGSDKHNVVVKTGPVKFQSPLQKQGTYKHRFR